MTRRPWRITEWWAKALFIGVAVLLVWVVESVALTAGAPAELALLASIVPSHAAVIVGARVFRVRDESSASRPWWQFTGRHRWSFVVAGGAGAVLIVYVITAAVSEFSLAEDVISFTAWGLIAAVYLNSGVRLRKRTTVELHP